MDPGPLLLGRPGQRPRRSRLRATVTSRGPRLSCSDLLHGAQLSKASTVRCWFSGRSSETHCPLGFRPVRWTPRSCLESREATRQKEVAEQRSELPPQACSLPASAGDQRTHQSSRGHGCSFLGQDCWTRPVESLCPGKTAGRGRERQRSPHSSLYSRRQRLPHPGPEREDPTEDIDTPDLATQGGSHHPSLLAALPMHRSCKITGALVTRRCLPQPGHRAGSHVVGSGHRYGQDLQRSRFSCRPLCPAWGRGRLILRNLLG